MNILLIILIIIFLIKYFDLKFDRTSENELLLWFGHNSRNYINITKLFKNGI